MSRDQLKNPNDEDDDLDKALAETDTTETATDEGDDSAVESEDDIDEEQYVRDTSTAERLTDHILAAVQSFEQEEEAAGRPFSVYDRVGAIASVKLRVEHEMKAQLDVENDLIDVSGDDDDFGDDRDEDEKTQSPFEDNDD